MMRIKQIDLADFINVPYSGLDKEAAERHADGESHGLTWRGHQSNQLCLLKFMLAAASDKK